MYVSTSLFQMAIPEEDRAAYMEFAFAERTEDDSPLLRDFLALARKAMAPPRASGTVSEFPPITPHRRSTRRLKAVLSSASS